jgi:hypothetical protein
MLLLLREKRLRSTVVFVTAVVVDYPPKRTGRLRGIGCGAVYTQYQEYLS